MTALGVTKAAALVGTAVVIRIVAGTLTMTVLIWAWSVSILHPQGEVVTAQTYDYLTYIWAARDWLSTGAFYEPYQLAGPYLAVGREILYPPYILVVLVPFTVLPMFLWWAIPLGFTAYIMTWHRPGFWRLVIIALILSIPASISALANGNPVIWALAACAAATRWGWVGPLALVKPSLAPFALIGIRNRRWWGTAACLGLVSLAFLPMWPDYVTVLGNARNVDLTYSVEQVPLMLVPVVAWWARR